jgi:hypothetical protein
MEIFIYIHMRDSNRKIVVKLLSKTVHLEETLMNFDAGKAKCFLERDRQMLLAIVETSFGTTAPFNSLVRDIFDEQLRGNIKSSFVEDASSFKKSKRTSSFVQFSNVFGLMGQSNSSLPLQTV